MKAYDFDRAVAVIADQVGSRTGADAVPAALAALGSVPVVLDFERTAGDEIQALVTEPASVTQVVAVLSRLGPWRIGIGFGQVDQPLPTSTRAARGSAYLAARAAVEAAHTSPTGLAVRAGQGWGAKTVGTLPYGDPVRLIDDVEGVLWMLRSLLQRRTEQGWELLDLLSAGRSQTQAAEHLGISTSAVSQRLARSLRGEAERGEQVARDLIALALGRAEAFA